MKMKVKWWVVSLVIAAVALATITGAVMAAGPQIRSGIGQCAPAGERGLSWGFGWGDEVITDLLGMTQEEICVERQAGKSLVQIAADNGISEDELIDAIMQASKDALQARVEAGTMTQEQADLRLEQMRERAVTMVNRTTTGPQGNQQGQGWGKGGKKGGQGMMKNMRQNNCTGQCANGLPSGNIQ